MKKLNYKIVKPILIVGLITFSIIISCAKDKVPLPVIDTSTCKPNVSYVNDIQPIMNSYCISCHGPKNQSGGYNLSNYNGVTSNTSKVLGSIRQDGSAKSMPQDGKIADSLIQKVYCWINQGAKNN